MSQVAGSSTSVYASTWKNDYRDGIIRDEQKLPRSLETGTGNAFAAGRISHFFDLRGASMTLDTACSTGAVALHLAVQSLRTEEASMAIVGGSNLMLNPDTFVSLGSAGYAFLPIRMGNDNFAFCFFLCLSEYSHLLTSTQTVIARWEILCLGFTCEWLRPW